MVQPPPLLPPVLLPILAAPVLLHACLRDVATRTIPDGSSMALAAIGLVQRAEQRQLAASCAVAAAVFAGGALLWRRGWLGGGDVKLLAACACLVPPARLPLMLGSVMIAGGLLALPYAAARRAPALPPAARPLHLAARLVRLERRRARRGHGLPYGLAIAAGALLAVCGG